MHELTPRRFVRRNRSGFTLIEMAVVVFIVGIIVSIIATILPSLIRSSKTRSARALMDKIDNTVQGYTIANHRLPFADGDTDGIEDTDVYVGSLPYRTLGLSAGVDVWGNTIQYGVYGVSGGSNNLTAAFADDDAFCTAVTSASTAAFTNTIVYTTAADPCSGADGTNSSNQAYVVASGGFKDLDGANGFFDLCNGESNPGFNTPNKIQSTSYDDLIRAFTLNELLVTNCGGTGAGAGGGGEDTYTNGCTNTVDDDGDTYVDCNDQDCNTNPACAPGPTLEITTTAIPSGPLNSPYTASIQATGGTTPYDWTLVGNGGFTDFNLNSLSGLLTGTLDQCPGTYAISVQVEDATDPSDGGPYIDAETFSLDVTVDLTIARTSGAGTTITWASSLQQETFQTSGGRLGNITWALNTGDASGFSVSSTGSNTCVIEKVGSTTPGTYTFSLIATDFSCPTNTAGINLLVTVTAAAGGTPGGISGIADTLEYNFGQGETPSIIHISGNVYAIAYAGPGDDGWLDTITIDASGTVASTGNSYEFDNDDGLTPDIIHVSGDVFAIAYTGDGDEGWLKTVTIDASGAIADTGNSYEFDDDEGLTPDVIHVGGDVYAIAYTDKDNDGRLKTVTIDASGAIATTGSALEFDTGRGETPVITHVNGDIYAIAYSGPGSDGWLKTVTIDASGAIAATGSALEFDTVRGRTPDIIPVSGDVYAIAYWGDGDDGWLKTVTINASGAIAATGSALEFDTDRCETPDIIHLAGDFYAIVYSGPGDDGYVKTVEISATGVITNPVLDTLEFDTTKCTSPDIIPVGGNIFVVAYGGNGDDGYIATIEFD